MSIKMGYVSDTYEVKRGIIDAASSGDNTIVSAVAGKKIIVVQYCIVAAGSVNVRFESGASGAALTGQMTLTTNSGISDRFEFGLFETEAGELLNLELSDAVSVDGYLSYIEV